MSTLLNDIRQQTLELLRQTQLPFHSIKRLEACEATLLQLADSENLDKTAQLNLQLALLFYYQGWSRGYDKAITESVEAATITLSNQVIGHEVVCRLLQSIDKKTPPEDTVEAVFRDTIHHYWSDKKIRKKLEALKTEQLSQLNLKISDENWYKDRLKELGKVQYYTAFAQQNWTPNLTNNKGAIKKALKKLTVQEEELLIKDLGVDIDKLKALKKKLAKVEDYPERGIETWFRLTSKNLYTRLSIVDTKSNIVMTVNTIIMSVALGSIYPLLSDDPHLIYGLAPLIIGNVISITFAIFATRPRIRKGRFDRQHVLDKNAALMTFDDFYAADFEDYKWSIHQIMQDKNFLYSTIIQDIYDVGVDLAHRYRYLRVAYQVFLVGIITSVILFGMCHALF